MMNNQVSLLAPAKINLNLNITGRRADGYHLLDSVVIFASLADHLTISIADKDSVSIRGAMMDGMMADLDHMDSSLHVARDMFRARTGWHQPLQIELKKNIPIAAGLGGGSSDAAAVLHGMAQLSGRDDDSQMDLSQMIDMALNIGADVPALMMSRQTTMLRMQGIGEVLTPLSDAEAKSLGILLVNPGISVSTAAVFQALRDQGFAPVPEQQLPLTGMNLAAQITRGNDMTSAAISLAPQIETTLSVLTQCSKENHGYGAAMSGSGATCFAIFPAVSQAEQARSNLPSLMPDDQFWCWAGGVIRRDQR